MARESVGWEKGTAFQQDGGFILRENSGGENQMQDCGADGMTEPFFVERFICSFCQNEVETEALPPWKAPVWRHSNHGSFMCHGAQPEPAGYRPVPRPDPRDEWIERCAKCADSVIDPVSSELGYDGPDAQFFAGQNAAAKLIGELIRALKGGQ